MKIENLLKYSDAELDLPERWFTGQQWADGTATKQLQEDYINEIAKKEAQQLNLGDA